MRFFTCRIFFSMIYHQLEFSLAKTFWEYYHFIVYISEIVKVTEYKE